jgi:hypothetical protein
MNSKPTNNQNFEVISSKPGVMKSIKEVIAEIKEKKKFFFLFGIIVLAIIILLLASKIPPRKGKQEAQTGGQPTPIPTETTSRALSPYATDSAIIKVDQSLQEIDKQLGSTDLEEAGLNPPVLNWQIKIE